MKQEDKPETGFRKMRRSGQQLTRQECMEILERNTAGTLAVLGDGGYPYAVPLSYVCENDALYFHCARTGHKLDAVQSCSKVSFCVIDQDQVVPSEYTTYYRSVILFGKATVLKDAGEIQRAIEMIAEKYAPEDSASRRREVIKKESDAFCIVKIRIEQITGKEAKELAKRKKDPAVK